MFSKLAHVAILLGILAQAWAQDSCKSVIQLTGAGSSFPTSFYNDMGPRYVSGRAQHGRTVDFTYITRNSGYGKERITLGSKETKEPVLFAGTESRLDPQNMLANPSLRTFPVLAGAIVIIYQLPEIDQQNETLALSTESLVGIFNGTIKYWDDQLLQKDNPWSNLPHRRIRTVARSDPAGNTEIFTHALGSFNWKWAVKYGHSFIEPGFVNGKCCNSSNWPANVIEFFANRETGMVGIVSSIPYTIGYAALPNAKAFDVQIADLINSANKKTAPTVSAIQAAMDYHFIQSAGTLLFPLNNALDPNAYPIASFSYLIVNASTHPQVSCCQATELAGFIDTVLSAKDSRILIEKHHLIPMSELMIQRIEENILRSLACREQNTHQMYTTSLQPPLLESMWTIILGLLGALMGVMILVGVVYVLKVRKANKVIETKWIIPAGSIHIRKNHSIHRRSRLESVSSYGSGSETANRADDKQKEAIKFKYPLHLGEFDQTPVFLCALAKLGPPEQWKKETKRLLGRLKDDIVHANVSNLLGINATNGTKFSVFESSAKGTLHYVLQTCPYDLTDVHKYNMACDIARGMKFLHRKGLTHCLLSSLTCFVDGSWTIKVCSWEKFAIYMEENPKEFESQISYTKEQEGAMIDEWKYNLLIKFLFLDPEVSAKHKTSYDIYSFGMMLMEIFTKQLPFHQEVISGQVSYEEILSSKFSKEEWDVQDLAMSLGSTEVPIRQMIQSCILGKSRHHKTFDEICARLEELKPVRKGIVDAMMDTMEDYMKNLETKVQERTQELEQITKKMKELLNEVLPPEIASKLFKGEVVPPEFFECVTVYFSDIVGFTDISAKSTPMEVMAFLNELWVEFDRTIEQFDVYKVDTIGDAYMVCSGLPKRNGINHCKHIADLSFALLEKCITFRIPHMRKERLKIRIGVNSGSVTAGIVGSKMPQYCVFGDTVNTASRMESSSLPGHIQISEATNTLLRKNFPGYNTTLRGEMDLKVKTLGILNKYSEESFFEKKHCIYT